MFWYKWYFAHLWSRFVLRNCLGQFSSISVFSLISKQVLIIIYTTKGANGPPRTSFSLTGPHLIGGSSVETNAADMWKQVQKLIVSLSLSLSWKTHVKRTVKSNIGEVAACDLQPPLSGAFLISDESIQIGLNLNTIFWSKKHSEYWILKLETHTKNIHKQNQTTSSRKAIH